MRSIPFILALTLLAGCERAPEQPVEAQPLEGVDAKEGVAITDARIVLPVVEGRPGAAYMTIANDGADAAELAAIHVDGAERVELHESKMAGSTMSMAKLDSVTVPAAGSVALEQGGLHAMVFGMAPDYEGETIEITLIFANGDKTSLDARVTMVGETEN